VGEAALACCENCLCDKQNANLKKKKKSFHATFIFSVECMPPMILHFVKQVFEIWQLLINGKDLTMNTRYL